MKFIHIADVHLGASPDFGYSWNKTREKEIWDSLTRLIEQIKREKTELLLVAGDLFHGQPLLRECRELNYLWEQIPDTAVVLVAGNHDYIKKDSAYLRMTWAPNVIGLWGENCQSVYIEKCNTYVYGLSYHSREIITPVYNRTFPGQDINLRKEHPNARHILLAHGGDEKHIPIQFSNLSCADFDYIALGHIHQPQIMAENKMAYAGSLEPLDRNHIGARGYIRGEICERGTKITFEPFAKREYKVISVSVTVKDSNFSVQEKVRQMIKEQGMQHIYRVELTGKRYPELDIQEESLIRYGNVIDVTDNTEPEYDFEKLRKQYAGTAVAAYIDSFGNDIDKLTEIEEKALYYGVWSLVKAGD